MSALEAVRFRSLRMLLLAVLFVHTQAAVVVHYFGHAACNANTALSEYSNPNPAPTVTDCITAPQGAVALYVDGLDDGCTVRSYTDNACANTLGLSITVGTCYFKDTTPIGSWRVVCPSPSSDPTVTVSLMSPAGTDMLSTPEPSPSTTMGSDIGPVLTSVETVTPNMTQASPPTDGGPMQTPMPSAGGNRGNGTDWSVTHSKLYPSGSPGLQGTGKGSGFGTSGADGVRALRFGCLKALSVLIVVSGLDMMF